MIDPKSWFEALFGRFMHRGTELDSPGKVNFAAPLTCVINEADGRLDVGLASADLVLPNPGGAGSLEEDAPTPQYVDVSAGSDEAAGTEEAPLLTLAEARRRIGDKHGSAVIWITSAEGPQVDVEAACLGRPRVGRRTLTIKGVPRVLSLEDIEITDITGKVVTLDLSDMIPGQYRGFLVDFGSGQIGCVYQNDASALTMMSAPYSSPTTASVYIPGIRLVENTSQAAISGPTNRTQKFDYLELDNIELTNNAWLTGALQFNACTYGPGGGVLTISQAYVRVGSSGVGISMRSDPDAVSPGRLDISDAFGTLAGMHGVVNADACSAATEPLTVTGGAISVESTRGTVRIQDFTLQNTLEVHGGAVSLTSTFETAATDGATIDEFGALYCNSDLSTFTGEDLSSAGAPIYGDESKIQRLT